jgi:peptidoglycan-N-acetylglucosamine deacetylase
LLRSRPGVAALAVVVALLFTACASDPQPRTGAPPHPTKIIRATTPPGPVVPAKLPRASGVGPGGAAKSTNSANVALTFDDGPDPVYTPRMLSLLKKQKVKATFCLVGIRARAYPSLVRRIVAEGHTLCNHTWRHRWDLSKQTNEVILSDLQATNRAIRAAAPRAKIKYFRAAGGTFNRRLVRLANALGMKSIYWSLDTRDWEFAKYGHGKTMVDHIVTTLQTRTRQGAIILAHDFRKPDTVAAFTRVLPWLKRNFKLIALPR